MGMKQRYSDTIDKWVAEIMNSIKDEDPLDGDETEQLVICFGLKLDLSNGNITQDEYDTRWSEV